MRVEVLGVLDRLTGKFRLRATEPASKQGGGAQHTAAKRFAQIFRPLPIWVRPGSRLIVDSSIDRDRLRQMGFCNVIQCKAPFRTYETNTNAGVMDYLKKVVPKMFQNSLSTLSTNQIQEFLDELTFREGCGHYPLLCFESFIKKLMAQTAIAQAGSECAKETTKHTLLGRFKPGALCVFEEPPGLSARLEAISKNPFGDWRQAAQGRLPQASQSPQVIILVYGIYASLSFAFSQIFFQPVRFGIDSLPPSLRMVDSPTVYTR